MVISMTWAVMRSMLSLLFQPFMRLRVIIASRTSSSAKSNTFQPGQCLGVKTSCKCAWHQRNPFVFGGKKARRQVKDRRSKKFWFSTAYRHFNIRPLGRVGKPAASIRRFLRLPLFRLSSRIGGGEPIRCKVPCMVGWAKCCSGVLPCSVASFKPLADKIANRHRRAV